MVDLNAEMADLWASLGTPAAGRPRAVQFVAARRGEGTSTVAREFARFAARRAGRSVWLVDLDLFGSPQSAAIAADPQRYGALGPATNASPDGSMFFTVQPPQRTREGRVVPDAKYLTAHEVGGARWWVTRFRGDALRGRQRAHLLGSADYWTALRKHVDIIVVDSPSIDRSQAALTVAPYMDDTVMVVAADQPDVKPPALLRDALATAGGRCAGVFFNRARVEPPAFLRSVF